MDLHQDPAADHQRLGPGVDARPPIRDAGPPARCRPDGIRVRYGSEVDIPIAWKDVYSVTLRKQVIQDKQPKVTIDENGVASLHMRIQNETNIEVRLERPVPLKLPHGIETVCAVKLYADEPTRFMDAVRGRI